jgi:hypothetical protein
MKLKQCHIVYDFNRDTVGILHRPGNGDPMSIQPADQEFVHAMFQWLKEGAMAWGVFGRLWNTITKALFGSHKVRRIITDSRGMKYVIVLTITEGRKAKKGAQNGNNGIEPTPGEAEGSAEQAGQGRGGAGVDQG